MTMEQIASNVDVQYLQLINKILSKLDNGVAKDRTNAGRLRLFSHQMCLDVREEFPLLSLKKTHFSSIVKELAWFCKGSTNISDLGCTIWDEWSAEKDNDLVKQGDIGPMYGAKWRRSIGIGPEGTVSQVDQLATILAEAKRNPTSSRLIVDCWDPHLLPRPWLTVQENIEQGYMALAPCHFAFQFFCEEIDGVTYMDLKAHLRSQDVFLGTPFNIASYALLLLLSAQYCGYTARYFYPDMGDCHIYGNHLEQVDEFLLQARTHLAKVNEEKHDRVYKPVKLNIPEHITPFNIFETTDEGSNVGLIINGLENYNPSKHIKFTRN